jgi:hypothetical protein
MLDGMMHHVDAQRLPLHTDQVMTGPCCGLHNFLRKATNAHGVPPNTRLIGEISVMSIFTLYPLLISPKSKCYLSSIINSYHIYRGICSKLQWLRLIVNCLPERDPRPFGFGFSPAPRDSIDVACFHSLRASCQGYVRSPNISQTRGPAQCPTGSLMAIVCFPLLTTAC